MSRTTPQVTVDLPVVERNIRRFHDLVHRAGKTVRSHVKAHRSWEIADSQLRAGAVGIVSQSTPEAMRYLLRGVGDIVLARPRTEAWRLPRIARFAAYAAAVSGGRASVSVHVADRDTVSFLAAECAALGTEIGARVDVAFTADRGVPIDMALGLARHIHRTSGVRLDGVCGYWGPSTKDDLGRIEKTSFEVSGSLVEIAEDVRSSGISCPVVSVSGSVNTAAALATAGVTEICSGAYALYDAGTAAIGLCDLSDVALRVRARVVGTGGGRVRTDADGLLAGACHDWDPDVTATRVDGTPLRASDVRVGELVELLPAHTCPLMPGVTSVVGVAKGRKQRVWSPIIAPELREEDFPAPVEQTEEDAWRRTSP
ncbi:alanine racemase [Nocardiopsis valliformis]|uniref:alanine racemase n=1 Tax=Nocardiopsis valliformis TaxID=239974 RepID=UPI00034BA8EA|nr:alanine racemase [Nocardiopsis valliformis]